MTEQLIAPVILPAPGLARGRPGRAGAGRRLPLADPLAVPLDAVYGMSRIDASGRLTSQVIRHVLNWQPGDRLTLTADSGVVVARRDPMAWRPCRPGILHALAAEAGLTLTPDATSKATAVLAAAGDGQATGNARLAVQLLTQATTNQAHRVITGPQPSDPTAIAAICPADIPEHLPSPEPSAHDQHPGQYL